MSDHGGHHDTGKGTAMHDIFKSKGFWLFVFLLCGGAQLVTQMIVQTAQQLRAIPYQIQSGSPGGYLPPMTGGGYQQPWGWGSGAMPYQQWGMPAQPNYSIGGWGGGFQQAFYQPQFNQCGWGGGQSWPPQPCFPRRYYSQPRMW